MVAGALPAPNGANTERTRGLAPPFPKGVSGNPSGRPKSFGGYVREKTDDGKALVDFAVDVLKGSRRAPLKYRLQALEWLADRGWGKAVQSHEITGEGGGEIVFTLKIGERGADGDD